VIFVSRFSPFRLSNLTPLSPVSHPFVSRISPLCLPFLTPQLEYVLRKGGTHICQNRLPFLTRSSLIIEHEQWRKSKVRKTESAMLKLAIIKLRKFRLRQLVEERRDVLRETAQLLEQPVFLNNVL
jgi:hypothetical protein